MSTIEETCMPLVPRTLSHPCLEVATQAALGASKLIRGYFEQGTEVRFKAASNLVTDADVNAEKLIASTIRTAFPNHAIMGEEENRDSAESSDLWIVDPLDGTNNFAHGIPHFAVSIGYYRDGIPELGIVVNPIQQDWYFVVRGQGAWHGQKRASVSSAATLDKTMIGTGFYYDRGAMMEATLLTIREFFRNNIHGVRRFGTASLDLCSVGLGRFGVFFEYMLHPWDVAAGRLFVEEAGGLVTTCEGHDLPISKSSCLASNRLLHESALQLTTKFWNNETPGLPPGNDPLLS